MRYKFIVLLATIVLTIKIAFACNLNLSSSLELSSDLNCSGTAVTFNANNIYLDCKGYTVQYANEFPVRGIVAINRQNISIRNCLIVQQNSSLSNSSGFAAIYFDGVSGSLVENVTISTKGVYAHGLRIYRSLNNSIRHVDITTYGLNSIGIYLDNSSRNVFNRTNVTTYSQGATLFNVQGSSTLNNATEMKLSSFASTSTSGLYVTGSHNNTFKNFTIYMQGQYTTALYPTGNSQYNTFEYFNITNTGSYEGRATWIYSGGNTRYNILRNFWINTTGTRGFAIDFGGYTAYNTIENMEIYTYGSQGQGVRTGYNSYNVLNNFTITTFGNTEAVYLDNSNTTNMTNFRIIAYSPNAIGINHLASGKMNYYENFSIILYNNSGYGISIVTNHNNTFVNFNITAYGNNTIGIRISNNASNNTFKNFKLDMKGYYAPAIYLSGSAFNSSFTNLNITSYQNNSDGIRIADASNSLFQNIIIDAPKGSGLVFSGSRIEHYMHNFTNVVSKGYEIKYFSPSTIPSCPSNIEGYTGSFIGIVNCDGITLQNISLNDGLLMASLSQASLENFSIASKGAALLLINVSESNISGFYLETELNGASPMVIVNSSTNYVFNGSIKTNNTNTRHISITSFGIHGAYNNTIENVSFFGQTTQQIYIGTNSSNYLLNPTNFSKTIGYASGGSTTWNITLQWYVRVNVTDYNNNPIQNAQSYFVSNQLTTGNFSATDSSGLTNWLVLNDTTYRASGGNVIYTSTNFTANAEGYISATVTENVNRTFTVNIKLISNTTQYIEPSCGMVFNTPGIIVQLTKGLNCTGSAIIINTTAFTLDCGNNEINYSWVQVGNGISIAHRNEITLRNCIINQWNSTLYDSRTINSTWIYNSTQIRLQNLTITTFGGYARGITIDRSNNTFIDAINITTYNNFSYGLAFLTAQYNNVSNGSVKSYGNSAHSIYIQSGTTNSLQNVTVDAYNRSSNALYVADSTYNIFRNVYMNATFENSIDIRGLSTINYYKHVFQNVYSKGKQVYAYVSGYSLPCPSAPVANIDGSFMLFAGCSNAVIENSSFNDGIIVAFSNGNIFNNLSVLTNGTSITFRQASYNRLNNTHVISTHGGGINFDYNSQFNNLSSINITALGGNGIYFSSTTPYNRLENLWINMSHAPSEAGIYISAGHHNVVRNVTIFSARQGITVGTTNNTIVDANITSNRTGLYFSYSAGHNNSAANITVYTLTTSSVYGVDIANARNNNLYNISVFTRGSNNYGLYIRSNSINNSVRYFYAHTLGSNSHGIFLENSLNNTVHNATIITLNSNARGLYFSNANQNYFENFSIMTNGSSAHGIEVYNAKNNTLRYFDIGTINSSAYGLYIRYNSTNNSFSELNISTLGSPAYGIFVDNASFNSFKLCNVFSGGTSTIGIYVRSASNNSVINCSLNLTNQNSPHIYFFNETDQVFNNTFVNITFLGQSINQTYLRGNGENFIVNPTNFNRSGVRYHIGASSLWNITLQWYVRVNVTNQNLLPISNAYANYTSILGTHDIFGATDSLGITAWRIINETTFRGSGGNINYGPYNITAKKAGYTTNSTSEVINESRTIHIVLIRLIGNPPQYLNWTAYWNTTNGGEALLLSLNWTDETNLSGYYFTVDNCLGYYVDTAWVPFSGTHNQSVLVILLNSSQLNDTKATMKQTSGVSKQTKNLKITRELYIDLP